MNHSHHATTSRAFGHVAIALSLLLSACFLGGCWGRKMAARIDAQLGEKLTTAQLPTALYDLDELNTVTLVLHGTSDAGQSGRYWYLLLVADVAENGASVNSIRECAYLTGSDAGTVLYGNNDVQITLRVEDALFGKRLSGTITGRLNRVAGLAEADVEPIALVKATFEAKSDSLGTFRMVEEHEDLITRLRRRRLQLDAR